MPKIDFKKAIVTASVASIGVALLLYAAYSIFRLPFLSWSGIAAFFLLLAVTLVTSRFTVPVIHVDGASQTQKSVADTLIFLAVMMYTLAPTNNFGPPIILAAAVACVSSLDMTKRLESIFSICTSVIATFLAALVYKALVWVLVGDGLGGDQSLLLNFVLLPLCVFGLVHYGLTTVGVLAARVFSSGVRVSLTQERV